MRDSITVIKPKGRALRKLDNWSKNESRIIFAVVMAFFEMALIATLGASIKYVFWTAFGMVFVLVVIWSIEDGRFRKS